MALNKGEWSELYAIFYLLVNRKLKLTNHKLNIIDENIFTVESIISKKKNGEIRFNINDDKVIPIIFEKKLDPICIKDIIDFKESLFHSIINGSNGFGAFELNDITNWLNSHNIDSNFKAKASVKEDIFLLNFDNIMSKKVELGYSIKSQLGSPATILNASSHTNFKYEVIGLEDRHIKIINSINSKNKLLDRIKYIQKCNAEIVFNSVESEIFNKNLILIDSLLPEALGEALLNSYILGEKDLYKLFEISTVYDNKDLSIKKLKDFLSAISFGMFPSKEWNGENTIKGGLLIVSKDSEIYVMDMVYFQEEVKKYLVNETKLDSPSTTRYNMLNLKKENDKTYFTLNIQVRYKK